MRPDTGPPPVIVVMGVAGSGKTTVGRALAARLGWPYRDADSFHSAANIARMRAGHALDDRDRAPWLAAIADWMDQRARAHEAAVIGCSALKRRYRDFLREGRPHAWFLYLSVARDELEQRLQARQGHFMPVSLLDSQLRALEAPRPEEPRVLAMDGSGTVDAVVDAALRLLEGAGMHH